MKKWLILGLVLGLVSVVRATPFLTGPSTVGTQGGTITLTITGTADEASENFVGGNPRGYLGYIGIDYVNNDFYYSDDSGAYLDNEQSAGYGYEGNSASAKIEPLPSPYYGLSFIAASTAGPWDEDTDVDVGPWFLFDVVIPSGLSVDTVIPVDMVDQNFGIVRTHNITVVPEPVTIALLGLGGLVLLGKRRA